VTDISAEQIDQKLAEAMGFPFHSRRRSNLIGTGSFIDGTISTPEVCCTESCRHEGALVLKGPDDRLGTLWAPTDDLNDAFRVVEWMREQQWMFELAHEAGRGMWFASFTLDRPNGTSVTGVGPYADTPAEAIARAVIMVLEPAA